MTDGISKNPVRYEDYAMFADCDEPKSFSEAMKSANWLQWQQAMNDEMSSLVENKIWQLVEKPKGRKIVDNRWVYKVKLNTNGCVDKFKARFVTKGFSQEAGVDFNQTYSPVARFDTNRAVLSVAASEKLNLVQFDVKTAFLYGELDEVIYMKQPAGYEDGTDRVCKLSRSLYGLKQSPRCWNKKFKDFLIKYGLHISEADLCLFYCKAEGHKLLIVLYVDDVLVAAQSEEDLHRFLAELKAQFNVTLSTSSCFLGMQYRQMQDGSVSINQESYIKRVLEKFGMFESNKVATPCERLDNSDSYNDICVSNDVPYREAVGSLMYFATGTRPDIAYAVSCFSQALEKPTRKHWIMVKRIFRYVHGKMQMGLMYRHNEQPGILSAYSDADYAGDASTRRSMSGIVCVCIWEVPVLGAADDKHQ